MAFELRKGREGVVGTPGRGGGLKGGVVRAVRQREPPAAGRRPPAAAKTTCGLVQGLRHWTGSARSRRRRLIGGGDELLMDLGGDYWI